MKIEVPQSRPIDPARIYLPADNPNRMTAEDYDGLRKYIRKVGFRQPLLVHVSDPEETDLEFTIIDGDHRTRICLELEICPSAIVVEATVGQRLRDRIAMNKRRGQLDLVATGRDLERLIKEFSFDAAEISATGFSNEEALELLDAIRPQTNEDVLGDNVPLPPTAAIEEGDKKWRLSFTFDSEAERAKVKAVLLEYADGGSTATGLLNALGALDGATDR